MLDLKKIFIFIFFAIYFIPANANYITEALASIKKLDSNTVKYKQHLNHYYSKKQGHKEALVIVTGVAEPVIKYWQLVDVYKDDYDIYLWDHIGQGKSSKFRSDIDHKKVYIDNFLTYENSFRNFLKIIRPSYKSVKVISHSMGSHLMLRQIIKEPNSISKLVMVTPMVNVKKYFIPSWLASFILNKVYGPTAWAPTQGKKNPDYCYLTNSKENFSNYMKLLDEHYPSHKSTGVTAGWLSQALSSIEHVSGFDISKLNVPMMVFTAGEDIVVISEDAKKFCSKMKDCESVHYPKGKHQLLIEVDDIRYDLLKKIKVFLNN